MPQSEANVGISPGCDEMPFLFLRICEGKFYSYPSFPLQKTYGRKGFILTSGAFKFIVNFLSVKSDGRRRI